MRQGKNILSNWGIAGKLAMLFCIFGLVPMVAVGFIAFSASKDMEAGVGQRFQTTAQELADKIDRNLFERYGDVQAFGYNDAIQRVSQWYDPTEYNAISQVMNKYVAAYGIYALTVMVDTDGKVIAVNTKDASGNTVNSAFLYEKNFRDSPWFRALNDETYTTKMPFTAPGNDVSTGTFVEDVHIDPDVKQVYAGDDGVVLGFSAPVYADNGEVMGYWSNRAQFSLVEDMFQDAYEGLNAAGYPGAELTLLDGKGHILVDYDPREAGTDDMVRNFDVLLKLNLADKGGAIAQKAVAGETGYLSSLHARKQIMQVGGYSHLKGALGFPGMNWSVLVRVPESEAVAEATAIQHKIMITALVCLGLVLPIGWWVGRGASRQIKTVQDAAGKMAGGDYSARVEVRSRDEIGQLGSAFNSMAEQIEANFAAQKQAQGAVEQLINAAAGGQLSERLQVEELDESFQALGANINRLLEAVVSPLSEAQRVLDALAKGNLTEEMRGTYLGEFDQMKTSLNSAIRSLTQIIGSVREAAESVTTGAEQITCGNEDLSQRTSEQASSLEETSASMEQMTSTVKQNADNAKQANQMATAAREVAEKGGAVTTRAVEAMGEINKSSKKIADIITVIDEIAFQTNLLALNAAVEAARAGEHGRGFAVVAAEVRNLAQRSATAAKEIKDLIQESIQRVTDGSQLVNQCGKTLEEIVGSVKRVTDIIAEIAAASQEQASGIDQVNKAILQMDEVTQQNAALVEQATSASQSMKDQAKALSQEVEFFTVAKTGSPPREVPRAPKAGSLKPQAAVMAPKVTASRRGGQPTVPAPTAFHQKERVGVKAGNAQDQRQREDEAFEEF